MDAFRAILSVVRGDWDQDTHIDIADLTWLIDYLNINHIPAFPHSLVGDVDCDEQVDISDLTAMIDYLFVSLTFELWEVPCYKFGD